MTSLSDPYRIDELSGGNREVRIASASPQVPRYERPSADVGASTLKQNAALVDRLRKVAIRSDRPPPNRTAMAAESPTVPPPPSIPRPPLRPTFGEEETQDGTTDRDVRAATGTQPTPAFPLVSRSSPPAAAQPEVAATLRERAVAGDRSSERSGPRESRVPWRTMALVAVVAFLASGTGFAAYRLGHSSGGARATLTTP